MRGLYRTKILFIISFQYSKATRATELALLLALLFDENSSLCSFSVCAIYIPLLPSFFVSFIFHSLPFFFSFLSSFALECFSFYLSACSSFLSNSFQTLIPLFFPFSLFEKSQPMGRLARLQLGRSMKCYVPMML